MEIIVAIASTTHIDRHNERMAKGALEQMARQTRARYIPYLVNHDFDKQVGVILDGKVGLSQDGEYALYVVAGIFENQKEKENYKVGSTNTVWRSYTQYLSNVKALVKTKVVPSDKEEMKIQEANVSIEDLLATHLDSTRILPDGRVYKIKRYIASLGDLRVHVYADHNPPHFHIVSTQRVIDARFDINTLELIGTKRGKIRESDIKKIKNFFELRPEMLKRLRDEHTRMNSKENN